MFLAIHIFSLVCCNSCQYRGDSKHGAICFFLNIYFMAQELRTTVQEVPTTVFKITCGCGSTYEHSGNIGYCANCKKVDITKYRVNYTNPALK